MPVSGGRHGYAGFQPMFDDVCPSLSGKKIALFGSYGWGDGEWIRDWKDVCVKAGANVVDEPIVFLIRLLSNFILSD